VRIISKHPLSSSHVGEEAPTSTGRLNVCQVGSLVVARSRALIRIRSPLRKPRKTRTDQTSQHDRGSRHRSDLPIVDQADVVSRRNRCVVAQPVSEQDQQAEERDKITGRKSEKPNETRAVLVSLTASIFVVAPSPSRPPLTFFVFIRIALPRPTPAVIRLAAWRLFSLFSR